MSERLPEWVDPWRLVQQRRVIEGVAPLGRMTRLVEQAGEQPGVARVYLEFLADDQGTPRVQGRIEAPVSLVCQRCLEPYRLNLAVAVDLVLVSDHALVERMAPLGEPLVVPDRLFLRDLIEDEMILALPQVPRHEDERICHQQVDAWLAGDQAPEASAPDVQDVSADRENPFAVLGELKRGK